VRLSQGVLWEWQSDSWDAQDRTRVAHARSIRAATAAGAGALAPDELLFPDGLAAHRAALDRRIAAAAGFARPTVAISYAEALTLSDFLHDAQARYVRERVHARETRRRDAQMQQLQEHADALYRMLDDRADTSQLHRLTQHADFLQRSLTAEAGARASSSFSDASSSSSSSSSSSFSSSSSAADQASARMKELLAAKFAAFAEAAQVWHTHAAGLSDRCRQYIIQIAPFRKQSNIWIGSISDTSLLFKKQKWGVQSGF
jgi:hypothetical protein